MKKTEIKKKKEERNENKEKRKKDKTNKNLITKETSFIELLEKKPDSFELLFKEGLHCLGCAMSAYETIEQGCLAHGMSQKKIDELVKKLNE
jgi:hybrid cluster-associated redox disulfide protein